jgi:hypothetical protein
VTAARRLLADGDVRAAVSAVARWLVGEPAPLMEGELAGDELSRG